MTCFYRCHREKQGGLNNFKHNCMTNEAVVHHGLEMTRLAACEFLCSQAGFAGSENRLDTKKPCKMKVYDRTNLIVHQ